MARAVRALLCGYYGYGNTGDEIVLAGILNGIRPSIDSGRLQVKALSGYPEHTRQIHSIDSVPRFSPVSLISAMLWADWLILGGGSLIQDSTSARSAKYYLSLLKMAGLMRVSTYLWAQGFGPLKDPRLRRASAQVLGNAAAITLRDEDSQNDLLSLGVDAQKMTVVADPAFLVEPSETTSYDQFFESANRSSGLVGIALRKWNAAPWDPVEIALGVKRFCTESGLQPMFLPFQQPHDVEISNQAAENAALASAVLNARPAPAEMAAIVGNFSIILGMRLHSLILAAAAGSPFIGINYDPKVGSFCKSAGMPFLEMNELTEERVYQSLSEMNANYTQQCSKIEHFRNEYAEKANIAASTFLSLAF